MLRFASQLCRGLLAPELHGHPAMPTLMTVAFLLSPLLGRIGQLEAPEGIGVA